MNKAQNSFCVTHSIQITLIQLAVTIPFKMKKKNTMTISAAMNFECYWCFVSFFFIIGI